MFMCSVKSFFFWLNHKVNNGECDVYYKGHILPLTADKVWLEPKAENEELDDPDSEDEKLRSSNHKSLIIGVVLLSFIVALLVILPKVVSVFINFCHFA